MVEGLDCRIPGLGEPDLVKVALRIDVLQVEPGDQLVDGPAFPQIGRQDRRREDHALIDPPRRVPHSRLLDLERPSARHDDLPRQVAVSNNLLPATRICSVSVVGEEGVPSWAAVGETNHSKIRRLSFPHEHNFRL